MSSRDIGSITLSERPSGNRSAIFTRKCPTFCSAVVRPRLRIKACRRDIAWQAASRSSRAMRGSDPAESLEPAARVTCDDGIPDRGFDCEVVFTARTKPEHIAPKQQVDNLPLAICPRGKPTRDAEFDPVPALYRGEFFVNLLAASVMSTNGDRIQPTESAFRSRITLVRPNRFVDSDGRRVPDDHALLLHSTIGGR